MYFATLSFTLRPYRRPTKYEVENYHAFWNKNFLSQFNQAKSSGRRLRKLKTLNARQQNVVNFFFLFTKNVVHSLIVLNILNVRKVSAKRSHWPGYTPVVPRPHPRPPPRMYAERKTVCFVKVKSSRCHWEKTNNLQYKINVKFTLFWALVSTFGFWA